VGAIIFHQTVIATYSHKPKHSNISSMKTYCNSRSCNWRSRKSRSSW